MPTRRNFVISAAAAAGAVTVLPSLGFAASQGASLSLADGSIVIHPVSHASFVMETPLGVVHVDPVGDSAQHDRLPGPDLILITHRHGDHYDADLLATLAEAPILTNADVKGLMPDAMQPRTQVIAPGGTKTMIGLGIEAIPAYNITEGRMDFHPKARGDLGFVLTIGGSRVYISGDTEGIPEMRSLKNIDLSLVCMNLPFTMAAEQAADAVADFAPASVIPYHYRGRDGGTQDPQEFARLLEGAGVVTKVTLHDWYNGTLG
ncbi:MBL fold metallo-hydrolase [Roseovarius sp. D22-M7]|uniref:MBL fold metallo-hydrolase n=1 Tax=Roseovarius sp. D22-M7 TaxID=3127116 RepID=UPI003010496C